MSYCEMNPFPEASTFDELLEERNRMNREVNYLEAKIKLYCEQIQLYKYILYLYETDRGYRCPDIDPDSYPF